MYVSFLAYKSETYVVCSGLSHVAGNQIQASNVLSILFKALHNFIICFVCDHVFMSLGSPGRMLAPMISFLLSPERLSMHVNKIQTFVIQSTLVLASRDTF